MLIRLSSWFLSGVTLLICGFPVTAAEISKGQLALPVFFFRNSGGGPSGVDFIARTPAVSAYLSRTGVKLRLRGAELEMEFTGANRNLKVEGAELTGTANFLIGSSPDKWITNLTLYQRVHYTALYAGIDMNYGGTDRRLKSEFVVAPGADPSRIRLKYRGFDRISVQDDGILLFRFHTGELRDDAPQAYQVLNGERVPIHCRYDVKKDGTVGFSLGAMTKRGTSSSTRSFRTAVIWAAPDLMLLQALWPTPPAICT